MICSQMYFDDIVLGSTLIAHTQQFISLKQNESKINMVGEIGMFLGLQIK